MELFAIQLTRAAANDLDHIAEELRKKILIDIRNLVNNPYLSGGSIKKLRGFKPSLYRLRSGDFRIIYHVEDELITVMRMINRKELEKIMKILKK
jgi:mRNA interferase RelE/StbE